MSERRSIPKEISRIVISIVILAAGVGGFVALSHMKQAPASADLPDKTVFVETSAIARHEGDLKLMAYGVVVPYREIAVSAEVAGVVTFKSDKCRAGRVVDLKKQPELVLVKIDPYDYEFEVNRLTEELNSATAAITEWETDLAGAKNLLALATRQYNSQKQEYERQKKVSGVLSATELDKAERAKLTAENAKVVLENRTRLLEVGGAKLHAAKQLVEVQRSKAQNDLSRTQIKPPVSGVIVSDDVEQGQFVQKGTPLFAIEDTSRVEVKCNLTKDDLKWIWLTAPASASGTDDESGNYQLPRLDVTVSYEFNKTQYQWRGHLDRFDGIGVDSKTRTVPCRVVVDDPRDVQLAGNGQVTSAAPRALMRNMYVTVLIHAKPQVPLWRVPRRAIRESDLIWVVENDELRERRVQIAQHLPDQVGVTLVGSEQPVRVLGDDRFWLPQWKRFITARKLVDLAKEKREEKIRIMYGGAVKSVKSAVIVRESIVSCHDATLGAGNLIVTSPLPYAHDGLKVRQEPSK